MEKLTKQDRESLTTTIDIYNQEIEEAVARIEAGEFYTHEEVEEMAKEW